MNGRCLDLSVIVVVYNQLQPLRLALQALLTQDFSGSYEVIFTDDGSSADLFRDSRDGFNESHVPVKYVWQQDRCFRAAMARNNGIKISRGRLLVFLDGDMIPALDTLRKHVETHAKPRLLVAGNRKWRGRISSDTRLPNGVPIGEYIGFLESGCPVDEKSRQREEVERHRRKTWLASEHPWRACFSGNVSVEWSPEVYFDENFVGWGPEDWEFNYRLCVQRGYAPVYRDDITTYHLETSEGVGNVFRTGTHEEIVRYMKNTFYFFDKCPGLPIGEVFFGFPRFVLDPLADTWRVVPRPDPSSYHLEEVVQKAKQWLSQHEN